MQPQTFDLGTWLWSMLFFLGTCTASESTSIKVQESEATTLHLVEPKDDEEQARYEGVSSKLTLILLDNKNIYAYEGLDVATSKHYSLDAIRPVIRRAKNKFAKEFVVVIKPAAKANYQATVNVLDEMAINKVENYAIADLNAQEKQLLHAVD